MSGRLEVHSKTLRVRAPRKGLHEITHEVARVVRESGVADGLCNIFLQHTSASIIISENADPTACEDLEAFLDRLVPEGASYWKHTLEGPDDMPAHVKSVLTHSSIVVPVLGGALGLGTWQGIYLWEHRERAAARSIVVSVIQGG
jgi:secondary thiamine-phosphate synthase enzyme